MAKLWRSTYYWYLWIIKQHRFADICLLGPLSFWTTHVHQILPLWSDKTVSRLHCSIKPRYLTIREWQYKVLANLQVSTFSNETNFAQSTKLKEIYIEYHFPIFDIRNCLCKATKCTWGSPGHSPCLCYISDTATSDATSYRGGGTKHCTARPDCSNSFINAKEQHWLMNQTAVMGKCKERILPLLCWNTAYSYPWNW